MFSRPRALSVRLPRKNTSARRSRAGRGALAALLLAAGASAQQPLFTFLQTSDSQAANEGEWQDFEDVLELIANAGKPGALLPRPIDLVIFPGDITEGNDNTEWVRCRNMFDTWLTSNNIPLLCIPGNRDQGSNPGQTSLYEQYIGSAAVWEASSASFVGQNGKGRNTGWTGLRFIGFNSSQGGYNKITASDVALIQARVSAAAAASENVFLITHHPHDGSSRVPLASVLTHPAIVGYMRGHSGNPRAQQGLTNVSNPNAWDLNTNAIVYDRDVIYYEVFQTQVKAYVIELNDDPSQLPAPKTLALVYPLRPPLSQNVGYQGGSHNGARPWPSGFAPEKKLWFQGGNWFGVLWHESSLGWRIFRLDTFAQSWVDTGTSVSSSSTRSFDALTDGTKLYLASHVYSVPSAPGAGSGAQVLRYSYNAATRTYTLDAGFPVTINDARTESLSLAKDTTGTLWASWTAGGAVYVNYTVGGNDATWSGPLPLAGASGLDAEDVPALVAFDGKLACLWTDRIGGELLCAARADGTAPTTWALETALLAPGAVSDTLDVAASTAGRLYVCTSTPTGAVRLLRRDLGAAGSGAWSLFTVADVAAGLSQPIVLIDETQQLARVFATGASSSGGTALGGGVIYEKDAPLATLVFPPGKGTVVLQDGQNFAMGRATSTRQPLSATTALVVAASNELSQRSWHEFTSPGTPPATPTADFSGSPRSGTAPLLVHFTDLSSGAPTDWLWTFGDGATSTAANPDHAYAAAGAYTVSLRASNSAGSNTLTRSAYVNVGAPPVVPTANFSASPLTGSAPLAVHFTDQSSGAPTSWLWTFGDGGTSTAVNPDHTYTAAGAYTVSLRAANGAGSNTLTRSAYVNVGPPAASTVTLTPIADTTANELYKTQNHGANATVRVRSQTGTSFRAFLKFDLAGVAGTITAAKLRLYCVDTSENGGSAYPVSSSWTETGLTWNAQPTLPASSIASLGSVSTGWKEVDVTAGVSGTGHVSLALSGGNTNVAAFTSREGGANKPQLVLTVQSSREAPPDATSDPASPSVTTRPAEPAQPTSPAAPSPARSTQTFHPIADAVAHEASPSHAFGRELELLSEPEPGSSSQSFLQFDLAALTGTPTSARLRLFVEDESNSGGSLYLVSNSWSEETLTWNERPELPELPIATAGHAPLGAWIEFDVSAAVVGPGKVSFALAGVTPDGIGYGSREGTHPPELVVETAAGFGLGQQNGGAR